MTAKDDTEYRIADKYLKDNLQDFGIEQGVIDNLQNKRYFYSYLSEKVCLSKVQGFIGLGISDSRNESIHNKLKSFIPKQMNYTMILKKVLEFIHEQNNTTAKELVIESIEHEL